MVGMGRTEGFQVDLAIEIVRLEGKVVLLPFGKQRAGAGQLIQRASEAVETRNLDLPVWICHLKTGVNSDPRHARWHPCQGRALHPRLNTV